MMNARLPDLKNDTLTWLLEEDNPSVRYLTLRNILDKKENDPLVEKNRTDIMTKGPVPEILSKQQKDGYWIDRENFYVKAKYRGTVWQVIILAELWADGNQEQIKTASEYILNHSQDRDSGGFAYRGSLHSGGDPQCLIPCLTGNMVWSMLRFGYGSDLRVQRGVEWLTRFMRFDDGSKQKPSGWPYRSESCWGRHTCMNGVVKGLKAFSEIPDALRSSSVKKTIGRCVDFILSHHLFKRSHDLTAIANPDWLGLGFPLMWKIDVLEMFSLLVKNRVRDGRMADALRVILSKRNDQGRWKLEKSFNSRMQVNIEKKGQPSKWITLRAMEIVRSQT